MSRWAVLLFCLLLEVPAWAATPRQVVVVNAGRRTDAKVRLVPGDRVAVLSVERPPARLIDILEAQRGPVLKRVERIEQRAGVLDVALYLASDAYRLSLRRLRRGQGFSMLVYDASEEPLIDPRTLIGRVPDTLPRTPWPVVLPPPARRHPCRAYAEGDELLARLDGGREVDAAEVVAAAARIDNRDCADYLTARYAALRLKRGEDPKPFEGWAFRFVQQDRWPANPYPYSYSAIVAASVLTQTEYIPEAEVLLGTDRIQSSPRLTPYRALALLDLMHEKGEPGPAHRIGRALVDKLDDPMVQAAAALRIVDLEARDDAARARATASSILATLPPKTPHYADLLLRRAELAWAESDWAAARQDLEAAASSRDRRVRAHAWVRLGDLAVHEGTKPARKRALRAYREAGPLGRCLARMVRLRRILLDPRDREILERNVMDAVDQATCRGEALEARFAMAELSLARNQHEYAMQLIQGAQALHDDDWSTRRTFDAVARRISQASLGRRYRNRDWSGLSRLYLELLQPRSETLSPRVVLWIAEGLQRTGLHLPAAELLRRTLKRTKQPEDLERLTLALARSYLEADRDYFAEIVMDYFRRVRTDSKLLWEVQLVWAELLLRQRNGGAALAALDVADKSTPEGDPRTRLQLLRAEAEFLKRDATRAAEALLEVLEHDWYPPLDRRGVGVNVLSLCVRECSRPTLERLLKALEDAGESDVISDRVRFLVAKRGIGPDAAPEKGSVWERLEQVAPDIQLPTANRGRGTGDER